MEARQIYKSGAVVLIVAMAIMFAYEALRLVALNGGDPTTEAGNALFAPTFLISLVGTTLFVVSFPITYARQAVKAGKTGLIGLGCYIASGLLFGYAVAAINAIIVPFLYGDPSTRAILTTGHPSGFVPLIIIGMLLFTVGNLCYGIGTLRARVYPRAFAFSLMVAAALEVGRLRHASGEPQLASLDRPDHRRSFVWPDSRNGGLATERVTHPERGGRPSSAFRDCGLMTEGS